MRKWNRFWYQPCLPLGRNGERVTGSAKHIDLSRRAAAEGMVLLKNDRQVLPLAQGQKIAVFGKGCADYVKGGGGSGDVTVAYVRSLLAGLQVKEQEGKLRVFAPLAEFYEKNVAEQYQQGAVPGMTVEPEVPEDMLTGARQFTDTAIISICRFSGENWDRTIASEDGEEEKPISELQAWNADLIQASARIFERGDFYLSKAEERMVELVKAAFPKVIVVLNVGGMVDSCWFAEDPRIQSVLVAWQGGMEGGLAAADLLTGEQTPSGKLTDTFAKRLEDYPSSYNFHESNAYVEYTDDIYVGYRYFETIPGAAEKVNYPFGYGLSYTEFEVTPVEAGVRVEYLPESAMKTTDGTGGKTAVSCRKMKQHREILEVYCRVTNTGNYSGKEVVQLYVQAPQGKLGKPARELKAFAKTRKLLPGESQLIRLKAEVSSLASYDDLGKVCKSAYVLEAGDYHFYVGTNVRDAQKLEYSYRVEEDRIVKQLSSKCEPIQLRERMLADGSLEALEMHPERAHISRWNKEVGYEKVPDTESAAGRRFMEPSGFRQLEEVAEGRLSLEEFLDQLSLKEQIHLLCGQPNTGIANTFGFGNLPDYGVPNVMTADGPAGLRIWPECGVTTTAFPCATLLACSWNETLVEDVGRAGGQEVLENNVGVWLTPAMNIHRSPLCGRNFEYYSEDPLVAGKTGAAMVRGIQSNGVAASVKHFACNNKETCRHESDSRVSERALREIYLKGFEIVVREADPWTIMSSYNILNGIRDSENRELLTDILRGEWNFAGLVTTDWWNHGEQYLEIKAGNDVKMGCGFPALVQQAVDEGRLTPEEIRICAKRMLELILKLG